MDREVLRRLTPAAATMRPLLNRLVFHGIHSCRGDAEQTGARIRAPAAGAITLHALATAPLERMVAELTAAGFSRVRRGTAGEEWAYRGEIGLSVTAASGDDPESAESVAREYAVLLTRTIELEADCVVRVSAPVPQLALYWQAHETSRLPITESEWIEDVIELVMRRQGVIDEVAAAPPELRVIIAQAARRFTENDSCLWVLRRAIPDARQVPAVADQARDRFIRLGAIAGGP